MNNGKRKKMVEEGQDNIMKELADNGNKEREMVGMEALFLLITDHPSRRKNTAIKYPG